MTQYRRLPAVEREVAGGRRLVQPVGAASATQLAGSAPVIWDLLAHHESFTQLRAVVQGKFDDAPDVIAAGTKLAIDQLLDAGLIEMVE